MFNAEAARTIIHRQKLILDEIDQRRCRLSSIINESFDDGPFFTSSLDCLLDELNNPRSSHSH